MNPGGPIFDWFAGYPDGKAAIEVRDGVADIVNEDVLKSCDVDGQHIYNLKDLFSFSAEDHSPFNKLSPHVHTYLLTIPDLLRE